MNHTVYLRPKNRTRPQAACCEACEWTAPIHEYRNACDDCGVVGATYTIGIYGGEIAVCFCCAREIHNGGGKWADIRFVSMDPRLSHSVEGAPAGTAAAIRAALTGKGVGHG